MTSAICRAQQQRKIVDGAEGGLGQGQHHGPRRGGRVVFADKRKAVRRTIWAKHKKGEAEDEECGPRETVFCTDRLH